MSQLSVISFIMWSGTIGLCFMGLRMMADLTMNGLTMRGLERWAFVMAACAGMLCSLQATGM